MVAEMAFENQIEETDAVSLLFANPMQKQYHTDIVSKVNVFTLMENPEAGYRDNRVESKPVNLNTLSRVVRAEMNSDSQRIGNSRAVDRMTDNEIIMRSAQEIKRFFIRLKMYVLKFKYSVSSLTITLFPSMVLKEKR